ncbi:MAG: hypothetical protein RLZZ546_112, partial [Bacteroidota bacterium]
MSLFKYVIVLLFAFVFSTSVMAQSQHVENSAPISIDCTNKLGAWIWYLRLTKFNSYENLADSLSSLGIKRIY